MVESSSCEAVEEKDEFDALLDNLERDVSALDLSKIELLIAQATDIASVHPASTNERKLQRTIIKSIEEALIRIAEVDSKVAPLNLMRDLLSTHLLTTRLCRKVFSPACIPIRRRNQQRLAQLEADKVELDKLEQNIPKLREQIYHILMRDMAYAVVLFATGCRIGPEPSQAVMTLVYGCLNFTSLFAYDVPIKGALVCLQLGQAKTQLLKMQSEMDDVISAREDQDKDERPRLVLLRHQATSVITYIDSVNQRVNRSTVYTLRHNVSR